MKTKAIFFFLFAFHLLNAQQVGLEQFCRALVIGISDYQDDKIQDLKYADKDAEFFANYLTNKNGGNIPKENITLLINEKASITAIYDALDQLTKESKKGEKAIIYFAGQGATVKIFNSRAYYLLAHNTSFDNYRLSAVRDLDLEDIFSTLSLNGVDVQFILDANHAGLFSDHSDNSSLTSDILSKKLEHEIKIFSCSQNQVAQQGGQWGGDYGVFTYFLVRGLLGEADSNQDLTVNLKEIQRYLEDQIETALTNNKQRPEISGTRSKVISNVNENYKSLIKSFFQ